jgi:transcriptional regulator with PAS, ATPase and Fis domain
MRTTRGEVLRVAETDSIVLFLGESGSGKDYLARYLHENSRRSTGPFFAINCAAVPSSLAESELFGHEAGAFTGAHRRKRGLLELAEGGTILLNEIGEVSPSLQAKLLTFLDTQMLTRVGGEKSISVNARILAATNRDLEQAVGSDRFRADLFYRLNVFAVKIPPLRERREDIPVLAQEIVEKLSKKLGRQDVPTLTSTAIEVLCSHSWPGNVRELKNALERALILSQAKYITAKHIKLADTTEETKDESDLSVVLRISDGSSMRVELEKAKKSLIAEALQRSEGNVSAAARMLGVSREILRHQMKRL